MKLAADALLSQGVGGFLCYSSQISADYPRFLAVSATICNFAASNFKKFEYDTSNQLVACYRRDARSYSWNRSVCYGILSVVRFSRQDLDCRREVEDNWRGKTFKKLCHHHASIRNRLHYSWRLLVGERSYLIGE